MKKRSIALIIGLMGFALLGVVTMQLYFLRQSYQLQSELFDRSVNEALNNVVAKVTRKDALDFLNRKTREHNQNSAWANKTIIDNSAISATLNKGLSKKGSLIVKKISILRDSLQRLILSKKLDDEYAQLTQGGKYDLQLQFEEFTDETGVVQRRMTPVLIRNPLFQASTKRRLHKFDTVRFIYSDPQFGKQVITETHINPIWAREQDRKLKERQLSEIRRLLENDSIQNTPQTKSTAIENLAEEYGKYGEPLKLRLDSYWIDTLLRFELHNKGINLPFSYEVTLANKDSVIFSKANDLTGSRPNFNDGTSYQTLIFSKEVINDPGLIRIAFPQKNTLILNRMTASMATTGGLLLVLILCFGYTIFSILRQKKFQK